MPDKNALAENAKSFSSQRKLKIQIEFKRMPLLYSRRTLLLTLQLQISDYTIDIANACKQYNTNEKQLKTKRTKDEFIQITVQTADQTLKIYLWLIFEYSNVHSVGARV